MTPTTNTEIAVAVTITGSLPNLQWQASPDPVDIRGENLIVYQLQDQTGSALSFCALDVSPTSSQFRVQSISAQRIELLDEDSSAGTYEIYLWVQDSSGQRYRSPDPQVVNVPE